MIQTRKAQKRLMLVWCIGGLFFFILLIIRTVGNIYGSRVEEAWSWFIPTIIPTLSLIITVAVMDFSQQASQEKQSDKFLFQLAFWVSIVYLVFVAFTILNPIALYTPIEMMKKSNLWLGPLQGLATATLGAFFIKGK